MKKLLLIITIVLAGWTSVSAQFKEGSIDAYTKTQLQTSGSASVNFNNISGVPDSLELAAKAHEVTTRTIYVAATGDDATGTGAVGAPFATIGKALSTVNKIIDNGVTVTISVGVGANFTLTIADWAIYSSISGAGILAIVGTLTMVENGFTMGSPQALDPLTYAVSGGNTATWTANQWRGCFLKSSTTYYPITHNSTTTLSLTTQVTGTEIYQPQTVITLPSGTYNLAINVALKLQNLTLVEGGALNIDGIMPFTLNTVFINNSSQYSIYGGFYAQASSIMQIQYCTFVKCTLNNRGGKFLPSSNIYINQSSSHGVFIATGTVEYVYNLVLEQTNTAANSCGLGIAIGGTFRPFTTGWLKFVNCNVAINCNPCSIVENSSLAAPTSVILVNTNYFLRKNSGTGDYDPIKIKIPYSNITGSPVTRWSYDNIYDFVNPSLNRSIQIPGFIYPEYEQPANVTITNNTTTPIQVGDSLQNTSIIIDYTAIRGDSVESGSLTIVNKMAKGLVMTEATPLGSDAGISFAISMIAPKKITLTITASNTVNGIFQYTVRRKMRTPLTI